MLLTKGIEVELFTGNFAGEPVGFARDISANLSQFCCEPDNRNVEYTTLPVRHYDQLLDALLQPRLQLRKYLYSRGHYTILPGSTLSLGHSHDFYRSTPDNSYHSFIEHTYGTNVVTASIHINIGITDIESLFKAYRLIRLEAPLYLALSASSPFLDGEVTGWDSTRWHLFPQTPVNVPLFKNHSEYIEWTQKQLSNGRMQNVRHFWSSVRPNGPARPHKLNRLELRICDLVIDPVDLMAMTALLEMRILMLLQSLDTSKLDPLAARSSVFPPDKLLEITTYNETVASAYSLDAEMIHWQTGEIISARNWIHQLYNQVQEVARAHSVTQRLKPILKILDEGNEAQRWLRSHAAGGSLSTILKHSLLAAERQELTLTEMVLTDALVPA